MKMPLNYAILKHFTKVDEASVQDVIKVLTPEYGHYKALTVPAVTEAIMTAESNALLEETHYDLDAAGVLHVYYRATPEQRNTINSYIKD